jgi:hypothetical protein
VSPSQIVQYAKNIIKEREELHKKVNKLVATSAGAIEKSKLDKLVELDNSGLSRIKSLNKLVSNEPLSEYVSSPATSVSSTVVSNDSEAQNTASTAQASSSELNEIKEEASSLDSQQSQTNSDETLTATEREDEEIVTSSEIVKCIKLENPNPSPVSDRTEKDKHKHKSTSSSGSSGNTVAGTSVSKPSSKSILEEIYSAKVVKNFKIPKQSSENKHASSFTHDRHHSSHNRAHSNSPSFARNSPDRDSYSNYYNMKSSQFGHFSNMRCGARAVTPPPPSSSMPHNTPSTFLMQ